MHTIIEDGDSLQIRATISDAKELGELIAKLESRRNGWKVPSVEREMTNEECAAHSRVEEMLKR